MVWRTKIMSERNISLLKMLRIINEETNLDDFVFVDELDNDQQIVTFAIRWKISSESIAVIDRKDIFIALAYLQKAKVAARNQI